MRIAFLLAGLMTVAAVSSVWEPAFSADDTTPEKTGTLGENPENTAQKSAARQDIPAKSEPSPKADGATAAQPEPEGEPPPAPDDGSGGVYDGTGGE